MPASPPQDEIQKLFATAVDLHRQGHLPQAESLYRTLLAVDPRHADALHLLGVLVHHRGDHAAGADLIGRAIEVNRRVPQYHFNRGVVFQALADLAGAAQSYRRAVQLKPDYAAAWENLGVALQDAGDFDGARAAYTKALAQDGNALLAHQNLGTLLLNLGRAQEAEQHFRAVLVSQPALAEAHAKYAAALLAQNHYDEGWREYEWRHLSRSATEQYRSRLVPFPKWDGSNLQDKTLLIHPEQGIGEELMFASCYGEAIAQAARVVIDCDPRLVKLFARSFPTAEVLPGDRARDFMWSASQPHIDLQIPAGSLPRFFRRDSTSFPNHTGYLRVDPERRTHWQRALATLPQSLNIGIAWSGGKDVRAIKARSIPLAEWQSVFRAVEANFINLQYGQHAAEIDAFHAAGVNQLHTLEGLDPFKDPDDAMALVAALDLVISIDNSTVFMAGSVGTPVWILLPSNAEWRWCGSGSGSPWYPQATLFRQAEPGIEAWRAVISQVASALSKHPLARVTNANVDARPQPVPGSLSMQRHGRALLVNDTRNWYHWGCSCTSLAIHSKLRQRWGAIESLPIHRLIGMMELPASLSEIDDDERFNRFAHAHADVIASLQQADAVYINGEGTLHGVNTQTLGLLYLAHIAKQRFGKTVHIINHSCYPDALDAPADSLANALYAKVYREMDRVAIREPISAQQVSKLGIAVTESFDCLPLFLQKQGLLDSHALQDNTLLIAGSAAWGASNAAAAIGELIVKAHAAGLRPRVLIGADAHLAADDVQFAAILQRIARGCFELFNATSELEWLHAIAGARLLVSGRFHHSIAAAFLGTPFILMESNTPKIAGLLQRLESTSFVSIAESNLGEALFRRVQHVLGAPDSARVSPEVQDRLFALAERNFEWID